MEIQELEKIKRKRRWDLSAVGMLVGLLFPMLGLLFLYYFLFSDYDFSRYLKMFTNLQEKRDVNNASKMLSLSIIANLIPFYFFLNKKMYQVTKGIIFASLLYGILIFMYKFVWQ